MVLYHVLLFADTDTGRLAVPYVIYTPEVWGPSMGPHLGTLLVAPKVGYQ